MMFLKNKTIWSWLGMLAAGAALFVAFYGIQTEGLAWDKWEMKITILLIAGVVSELAYIFIPFDFMCLLPAFIYCGALVYVVNGTLLVSLDYIRQINWVNGNYSDCVLYLVFTLAACVITAIRCFMTLMKSDRKAVAA